MVSYISTYQNLYNMCAEFLQINQTMQMWKLRLVFLRVRSSLVYLLLFIFSIVSICYLFIGKAPQKIIISLSSSLPSDAVLMIPELIEHMKWEDNENILDYGCGNGEVGYHLIFPKVQYHDSNQYAVEYAYNNLENAINHYSHPNIKYAQGNLLVDETKFPFKDVKFDKIFSIYVFHLVPDLEKLLDGFHNLMKTGGQLGFTTLTDNNLAFKIKIKLCESRRWQYHMRWYKARYHPKWSSNIREGLEGENKMKKMFENTGFRMVHLKIGTKSFRIESVDILVDSMFWLSPAFEDVPDYLVAELKNEIIYIFTDLTGLSPAARNFSIEHEYILGVAERE